MDSKSVKGRAIVILGFLALLSGCTPQGNTQSKDSRVCLVAEVSSTDDAVLVKNSGGVPWNSVEITFLTGPIGTKPFKFKYSRPTLDCASMINVDLSRFIRDDGVAYDRNKFKLQGIKVTTDDPFAVFKTTAEMSRDDYGLYENECKTDF
jgi:hypothetical protein